MSNCLYAISAHLTTGLGNEYLDNDVTNSGSGSAHFAIQISNDPQFVVSGNNFTGSQGGLRLMNMDGITLSPTSGNFDGNIGLGTVSFTALELNRVNHATVAGLDLSWTGTGRSGTGIRLASSSNNTAERITIANRSGGISMSGSSQSNQVSCSSILNNNYGVSIGGESSGNVLNHNHIEGNSTGVYEYNSPTSVVNAENNYWGAADGPSPLGGSGDSYIGNVDAAPFLSSLPPCLVNVQEVLIDVKPDSENDVVNLAANGVLPVVIYTTADFDAAMVDVSTVTFGGADVALSALEDVDDDGDLDLVLHFLIVEMVELEADYVDALLADLADGFLDDNHQNVLVTLMGQTTDGTAIQGTDTIDAFFAGKALRDALLDI